MSDNDGLRKRSSNNTVINTLQLSEFWRGEVIASILTLAGVVASKSISLWCEARGTMFATAII